MSNILDPKLVWYFVLPDLGPMCSHLQKLLLAGKQNLIVLKQQKSAVCLIIIFMIKVTEFQIKSAVNSIKQTVVNEIQKI